MQMKPLRMLSLAAALVLALALLPSAALAAQDLQGTQYEHFHYVLLDTSDSSLTVKLTGSLPKGLSFKVIEEDMFYWVITGTPTESGVFEFTATLSDGSSTNYSLEIKPGKSAPAPTPAPWTKAASSNLTCKVGKFYDVLLLDGVPYDYYTSFQYSIPGMEVTEVSGQILLEGTPTKAGSYSIRIEVVAGEDVSWTKAFTLTVEGSAPAAEVKITTKSLPEATVGKSYSATIKAENSTGAEFGIYFNPGHKNEFDSTGLKLSSTGKLSGTPKKAGSYTFTVYAINDVNDSYKEYTLKINAASSTPKPTTTPTVKPSSTPGQTALWNRANDAALTGNVGEEFFEWLLSGITYDKDGDYDVEVSGIPKGMSIGIGGALLVGSGITAAVLLLAKKKK